MGEIDFFSVSDIIKVVAGMLPYHYNPQMDGRQLNTGATDWDAAYIERIPTEILRPRRWLVDHSGLLPDHGLCFEAAVGLGGNLPFLLQHGYQVFAADRSNVAVRYVKKMFPDVRIIQADLHQFMLPENKFSLIVQFYYLEWNLVHQYLKALVPGGIVVLETLTIEMLKTKPEITPDHLLKPGELRDFFHAWDVLDYREGWIASDHGGEKAVASILARKKQSM